MGRVIVGILLALLIIYLVPFVVYSIFTIIDLLEAPKDVSPLPFLAGILVSKVGTAVAFVLILYVARDSLAGRWMLYAFLWWLMFLLGEIGQAIGPDYTWPEAIAGIISETVYCPLAAYVVGRLLAGNATVPADA